MPERRILHSHSENSCTRYENKKLQHSPPLKFSLVPGGGRTPNPVDGLEAGAIFIAEGHCNLKPVLPLDAQEFNPQIGCTAGFNYGDYKKIELPDGKNGNTISGYDSTDLPSVLPAEKRRTLSCSPWRKGILENERCPSELIHGMRSMDLEHEILTRRMIGRIAEDET